MKRCPECRRDYYDETLLYCLDDGNALLDGPASAAGDEPATAVLAGVETPTQPLTQTTDETARISKTDKRASNGQWKKNLSRVLVALVIVLASVGIGI